MYKYNATSGRWKEKAKLTASNGEGCSATCTDQADYEGGDYFGWRVAISGTTAAVGALSASIPPAPDGGTSDTPNSTGTAYVFTGSGASWTQQDELYSPAEVTDGGQDWFGSQVAVMTNSSVVVGAQYDSEGNGTGAAFVFPKQGASWATYPVELTALDGAPDSYFGTALTTIGRKYVVVGAPASNADSMYSGNVYIYEK